MRPVSYVFVRLVFVLNLVTLVCCGIGSAAAEAETGAKVDDFRGWEFLVNKLRADGIAEATLRYIYQNPRMPRFSRVSFSLNPRETDAQYRAYRFPSRVKEASNCLALYRRSFEEAQQYYEVDAHVIAAIMMVETHCGRTTGDSLIINRLSRLAGIAEPQNLEFNLARLKQLDPSVTMAQVAGRAQYLEETFYPEVLALIHVAESSGRDIFDFKGSFAGAFGWTQFLPTAFLKFGVDGDKDGNISLFDPADAIASTANFLSSYGWRTEASIAEKKQVIWKYNHSQAYVDAVLDVAELIKHR